MFNNKKKLVMIQKSSFCNLQFKSMNAIQSDSHKSILMIIICKCVVILRCVVDAAQRARDLLIRSQHFQTSFYVIQISDSRWGALLLFICVCQELSCDTPQEKQSECGCGLKLCFRSCRATEQMILLNERVNHLISCLHHKGAIAVRFSGLNGF